MRFYLFAIEIQARLVAIRSSRSRAERRAVATLVAQVLDDSDLVGLGAILGSVDEIEIEAGATATMDAGDYLTFLGNGGTFTGAGSVQVLGADIAQAVQVSDDTIVSGYEVADDADLQDLTVDQAVVYTAADNYTPPQSGGAEFTISDTGAALFAAEDNGEAERVTLFDAVAVVATGGFAVTDNSLADFGPGPRLAMVLIMLAGAVSFATHSCWRHCCRAH